MYTVFLSSYKNTSGSLGEGDRNAVETRVADECFYSEFSQTFTSVSTTREKHGVHVFYFFDMENTAREKENSLLILIIEM